MKQLELTTEGFKYLERGFENWLGILGYSDKTVYLLPIHIREFLYYLETEEGITQIKQMNNDHVIRYYHKLSGRQNTILKSGSIGANHLNKHQQAITLFWDYLRQSGRVILPVPELTREVVDTKPIEVLTENEIGYLFDAINEMPVRDGFEHLRIRDRAILGVFYCLGLRRNEGYALDIGDIDLDRRIVRVRKGKNYKQRFVPIHSTYVQFFEEYINYCRPVLVSSQNQNAFFVSARHQRMDSGAIVIRLKKMVEYAQIDKRISLHTLRHSIATHLLQNGMRLESISQFLGHSSLESTQIYTHLVEENSQGFSNL